MTDVLEEVLHGVAPADRDDDAGLVALTLDSPGKMALDLRSPASGGLENWIVGVKSPTAITAADLIHATRLLTEELLPEGTGEPGPQVLTSLLLLDTARTRWQHAVHCPTFDYVRLHPGDLAQPTAATQLAAFVRKWQHLDAPSHSDVLWVHAAAAPSWRWHTTVNVSRYLQGAAVPDASFVARLQEMVDRYSQQSVDQDDRDGEDDGGLLAQIHEPPTPEQARQLADRINAPDAATRKLPPRR